MAASARWSLLPLLSHRSRTGARHVAACDARPTRAPAHRCPNPALAQAASRPRAADARTRELCDRRLVRSFRSAPASVALHTEYADGRRARRHARETPRPPSPDGTHSASAAYVTRVSTLPTFLCRRRQLLATTACEFVELGERIVADVADRRRPARCAPLFRVAALKQPRSCAPVLLGSSRYGRHKFVLARLDPQRQRDDERRTSCTLPPSKRAASAVAVSVAAVSPTVD